MDIIKEARNTLQIEIDSLINMRDRLDENFIKASTLINKCDGRVIVVGIGKSGWIGRKISATFASTGTPSFFLHPAEGIHGDLGMLMTNDLVLMISNSGETEEILRLIPTIKKMGLKMIALTGRPDSHLGEHSDVAIDIGVDREACPLNIAPTSSTTATLAMGDALAAVQILMNGFAEEDFAFFHPGGTLGKKLLLTVDEVMHYGDDNPTVNEDQGIKETIMEITSKGLGATSVIDPDGKMVGIITDGDLRRAIERSKNIFEMKARDIMTKDPLHIEKGKLAAEAVHIMEDRPSQISVIPVVDGDGCPIGMIRIHDLVKAGVA